MGGLSDDSLGGGGGVGNKLIESGDVNFTLTNNKLTGLGTDTLSGIQRVILTGGAGDNIINAFNFISQGTVTFFGGSGNDRLIGEFLGGGIDFFFSDSLDGGNGDDLLTGGFGDDTLIGGSGFDEVIDGGDDFSFILTNTKLISNHGNDTLSGIERVRLNGGVGNNNIDPSDFSSGIVILQGEAGNDTLKGGAGNDELVESGDTNFFLLGTNLLGNGNDTLSEIERVRLTGAASDNLIDASASA